MSITLGSALKFLASVVIPETSGRSWVGLHVICISACSHPTHSQGTTGSPKMTLQSSNNLGLELPAAPQRSLNPHLGLEHRGNKVGSHLWWFLSLSLLGKKAYLSSCNWFTAEAAILSGASSPFTQLKAVPTPDLLQSPVWKRG